MISSKHGIYMASTSCIFIYHDIHTSLTSFLNSASWHWGQQFQRQHCRCPGSRRDVDLESLHCVLTGQKNDGRMVLNCSVSVCRTVFWEQACQQCQASTAVSAVSTMLFKDCVGSPPHCHVLNDRFPESTGETRKAGYVTCVSLPPYTCETMKESRMQCI